MEYAIVEKGQNEWAIIDENENIIDIITNYTIVKICERELERCHVDVLDIGTFIDNVWYLLNKGDNIIYNQVNTDTEDYEKFCIWFDYVCAVCFGNEIISYHKQRLLNFE